MIKLSIILPSFKRVDQTLKTLDLIFRSKDLGIEYQLEVIIADSSPDDILKNAVQEKFGEKVTYTRPERPGISANKNQGAKIATGSILIFCDSDMEVEPETILNTLSAFKKHETAAVVGGQVIWKNGSKDGILDRPRKEDRMLTVNGTTYVEAIYSRYIAVYKQVFEDVGGYDEVVFNMRGEGSDLSVRYWRAGYPLVYDPSIIVHHVHDAPNSIALRIDHPEWAIAKDLVILAYKYDILDDKNENFINTVAANFEPFGRNGYYEIVRGITKNYSFLAEVKPKLDEEKKLMKSVYNFKFLEIFSDRNLVNDCIKNAKERLIPFRHF